MRISFNLRDDDDDDDDDDLTFCSGFITDQQEYREHVEMSRK